MLVRSLVLGHSHSVGSVSLSIFVADTVQSSL